MSSASAPCSSRDQEHALDAPPRARLGHGRDYHRQHHRGRVFKVTGDGLLAEFVSPVEAVRASLEIQEAMRSANATAGPDDQLVLRIGINLGDIVESGDDLMGDAVNVAVRLESIAPQAASACRPRSTSRSSASSLSAPRTWASSTSRTSRAPSMPTGSRRGGKTPLVARRSAAHAQGIVASRRCYSRRGGRGRRSDRRRLADA